MHPTTEGLDFPGIGYPAHFIAMVTNDGALCHKEGEGRVEGGPSLLPAGIVAAAHVQREVMTSTGQRHITGVASGPRGQHHQDWSGHWL